MLDFGNDFRFAIILGILLLIVAALLATPIEIPKILNKQTSSPPFFVWSLSLLAFAMLSWAAYSAYSGSRLFSRESNGTLVFYYGQDNKNRFQLNASGDVAVYPGNGTDEYAIVFHRTPAQ